jgi:excisionase family DNA binding protein
MVERIYKIKEVADILKVSHKTVYNWIELGHLKAIKVEKTLRVPESALEEFLKENITTPFIEKLHPNKSEAIKTLLEILKLVKVKVN